MRPGKRFGLSAVQKSETVAPLEGGTVAARDWARVRQESFVHSLRGVASRRVCSGRLSMLAPSTHTASERGYLARARFRCSASYDRPASGPCRVDGEPGSGPAWWPFCISCQRSGGPSLEVGVAAETLPTRSA